MAIAGLGNGGICRTKIEALASELRLLKCGMVDMQGRLDVLLIEIGAELQAAPIESEPAAEVHEAADSEATFATEMDLFSLSLDVTAPTNGVGEPAPVAEPTMEAVEAAQTDAVEQVEVAEAAVVPDAAVLEPTVVEPVLVETTAVDAPAEPTAETLTVVDAIPTVNSIDQVAPVEVCAEAIVPAAEQVDTPAGELPNQNVVILAEHRPEPGKPRGVIARTMRWAAAIVLIATVAAVAAAGTGFAGNGELLIKSVCAIAGEACSITLGMP